MFLWDRANIDHVARHDVLPSEAEQVVLNSPLDLERQIRNGEERTSQLGTTDEGRLLVVIATMRDGLIRVVTAFPAKKGLRRFYLTQRGQSDGEGA